jgi:hypothetical protein
MNPIIRVEVGEYDDREYYYFDDETKLEAFLNHWNLSRQDCSEININPDLPEIEAGLWQYHVAITFDSKILAISKRDLIDVTAFIGFNEPMKYMVKSKSFGGVSIVAITHLAVVCWAHNEEEAKNIAKIQLAEAIKEGSFD